DGALAPLQRLHARGAQALANVVGQFAVAFGQARRDAAGVSIHRQGGVGGGFWRAVHSTIPLAFRERLRVCTARKQWVLTLPSEQPMAAAVSATSISSQ